MYFDEDEEQRIGDEIHSSEIEFIENSPRSQKEEIKSMNVEPSVKESDSESPIEFIEENREEIRPGWPKVIQVKNKP